MSIGQHDLRDDLGHYVWGHILPLLKGRVKLKGTDKFTLARIQYAKEYLAATERFIYDMEEIGRRQHYALEYEKDYEEYRAWKRRQ